MAEKQEVIVVGEIADGRLAAITLELLGIGRKLANALGKGLGAILMGSGIKALAQEAISLGADKVYLLDNPLLGENQPDACVAALEKACRTLEPDILLMGQTPLGRNLAPRLAFRLGTGVAMDCVELEIDPATKLLAATRPVYGGNARGRYSFGSKPQMATIRIKAMEPAQAVPARKGEVVPLDAGIDASVTKARVMKRVKEEAAGVKLEDAPVVVSGGRGIGGSEGFRQLEELAKLFKGAVGTTRSVIDQGWMPSTTQVGLTGKIVSPDLYIAVALSGASQHMAGCSGSKVIVAINKDPQANIFKEARYGVVGDYRQVLPAFCEKCKQLLSG